MSYYTEQVAIHKKSALLPDYLINKIIVAKHFIDNNYDEAISLSDISNSSLISKYHFIRLFKKTYGRTPNEYLVEVRISAAKRLLKDGVKIPEVCMAVGFSSTTSFIGLFKKISGITPGRYALK